MWNALTIYGFCDKLDQTFQANKAILSEAVDSDTLQDLFISFIKPHVHAIFMTIIYCVLPGNIYVLQHI